MPQIQMKNTRCVSFSDSGLSRIFKTNSFVDKLNYTRKSPQLLELLGVQNQKTRVHLS